MKPMLKFLDQIVYSVYFLDALMQKVISQNRRSLDTLAARCYFYYQRSFELIGQMDKARR